MISSFKLARCSHNLLKLARNDFYLKETTWNADRKRYYLTTSLLSSKNHLQIDESGLTDHPYAAAADAIASKTLKDPNNETGGRQNTFYFEESPLKRTELYDKTPVVLILGWTGSKDKHLIKFKNIYSSFGFHTIRFAPTNKLTFLKLSKHKPRAYELLRLMKDKYKLTNNPIFIHTFSNAGGFIVYQHLINEMNGTNGIVPNKDYAFFKQNHCGIIFDSGLGWPKFCLTLNGITDLISSQVKNQYARYAISTLIMSAFLGYQALNFGNSYFTKMITTCKQDPRLVPTLSIYSKHDKLLSASSIDKYFKHKKKLFPDLPLKVVRFEHAPHVMIYQTYPDEYVKLIKEHLELCKLLPSEKKSSQQNQLDSNELNFKL